MPDDRSVESVVNSAVVLEAVDKLGEWGRRKCGDREMRMRVVLTARVLDVGGAAHGLLHGLFFVEHNLRDFNTRVLVHQPKIFDDDGRFLGFLDAVFLSVP